MNQINGQKRDKDDAAHRATPDVRDAHDAEDIKRLKRHPDDEDAQLEVALDETFPTSDPPSTTQPGHSKDMPESSGYDEKAERKRQKA